MATGILYKERRVLMDKQTKERLKAVGISKYMMSYYEHLQMFSCTQISHIEKMIKLLKEERKNERN